jgi:hypothetical protein
MIYQFSVFQFHGARSIMDLCAHSIEPTTGLYINLLKTSHICFMQGLSAYHAVNTPHFGYKNQSLNVL